MISLKNPSYQDYAHIYAKRFSDDVMYWADDDPHVPSLEHYAYNRLDALACGEIIERILVLEGEPIGTITARDFDKVRAECTLGIVIANPKHWGHGYGVEALKQFKVILACYGFRRVYLETYANNKRAQKCFMQCGFEKKRAFYSPPTGRFIVQMTMTLQKPQPIGERILPGDPRWKAPKKGSMPRG